MALRIYSPDCTTLFLEAPAARANPTVAFGDSITIPFTETSGAHAVAVGTVPKQLVAQNTREPSRVMILITNRGPNTIFMGEDETVSVNTGFPLAMGDRWIWQMEADRKDAWYRGAIWAVSTSGGADVRVWEVNFI